MPKREDIIRKTEIMRKINPENCDYMRLGQQNVWLQWAFINETLTESDINITALKYEDGFSMTLKPLDILNNGTKAAHLIDHYNFNSDEEYASYKENINTTLPTKNGFGGPSMVPVRGRTKNFFHKK